MKKTVILALCCFLSAFAVQAQKGYESGYAVTNAGDTVSGMIKHKSGDEIKENIIVKISEEEKENFSASEITYFMAGDEEYVSKNVDGEEDPVFMRRLSNGYLTLLEYQYAMDNGGTTMLKYEAYIIKEGSEEMINIKPGNFKKQMGELVSDYTELAEQVDKNKYKMDDIDTVVNLYNNWKVSSEEEEEE